MFRKRRDGSKVKLPTLAVGGELPSNDDAAAIKKDVEEKIEKYKSENPEKPDEGVKLEAPVNIKIDPYSLEREYIELAKRYVGIPPERNPSVLEMSKMVIKTIDELKNRISHLERHGGFRGENNVLFSSDCGGQWN